MRPRLVWAGLVIAGLVVIGYLGYRQATRPVVRVTNALVLPVIVRLGADAGVAVGPGAVLERRADRAAPVVVEWEMVRARTRGGIPVGEALDGSIVIREPRRETEYLIRPARAGADFFAPLITNETGVALAVRVNAGLADAVDCQCEVPPGASRVPVGYYRLFRNSTVEVRDSAGRRAIFRELGPEVDPRSGAVGLRFGPADLR